MSLTFEDMFCGAGGSTLGAWRAGLKPVMGLNHWPLACESYATNHAPHGADVDCADVAAADPRRYPGADILLASPECTYHSYARGRPKNDPALWQQDEEAAERSRATMYDIPRFAEVHDYKAIIVENVEAVIKWGNPKGKKLPVGSFGPLFEAWLKTMEALEYKWRLVHINAAICGVPQSRDRLLVVFWKKDNPTPDLDFYALGWCWDCGHLAEGKQTWKNPKAVSGTLGSSYYYPCPKCAVSMSLAIRPAAAAIDWSLEAPRIGDRKKPLAPNTVKRIERGLAKIKDTHDQPTIIVQVGGNLYERPGYARAWSTTEPLKAITKTADRALVVSNMNNNLPRVAGEQPMHSVTTGARLYLLEDAAVVAGRGSGAVRAAQSEPLPAETTINSLYLLDTQRRNETHSKDATKAVIPSITAGGTHHGLVVANHGSPKGPASKQGHSRDVAKDPLGTLTSKNRHSLVTLRGGMDGRPLTQPLPTTTKKAKEALVVGDVNIEDCGFRMLQPHELKRGQDFDHDYHLVGGKRDQVAQIGNAVPGAMMEHVVGRVAESLA